MTMTDTDTRNLATVGAVYEAFGRGDVPAILDLLADDIEWERHGTGHGVPWLEPGTGRDHVGRFFQLLAENLEFLRFEPQAPLVGEGMVAVPVLVECRVLHNDAVFEDYDVHVWWFDADGTVVAFRHLVDSAKHLAAFTA